MEQSGGDNSAYASSTHNVVSFPGSSNQSSRPPQQVAFHRTELAIILNVYGRRVAQGEWRDYAIDHLKDRAIFSIFRRASEMPLYRIEKDPRLARKQGEYSVLGASGQVLKRGHDLKKVLRVLESKKDSFSVIAD
jgi:hypothetical protein